MPRYILWTVVTTHLIVIIGNLVSILLLPVFMPWYVALPLMSLLINLLFAPVPCPLTKLENKIRKELEMKEIKHFVGHYLVWPIKRKLRSLGQYTIKRSDDEYST